MSDPRRVLGRELRRLRVRVGLSGQELAFQIGTNQTRISRIETAVVRPKIADVVAWLDATGARPTERAMLLKLTEDVLMSAAADADRPRGAMTIYDAQLPSAFPYRVDLAEDLALEAVRLLAERTEQFPHGSSFAVTADLYDAGMRRLWLSRASLRRLRDCGLFTDSTAIAGISSDGRPESEE